MNWRNKLSDPERRKLVQKASSTLWTREGWDALKYLKEERGLSESVLKEFQVGYVPLRVEHQLRGRIITPIIDPSGDLIAISTRHLHKKKDFWHEDYEKRFHVYGMQIAKKAILKYQKVAVVEGEFDTLSMHTRGIPFAIGICGSAFTFFQVSLISRYATEIYLLFDGDEGGDTALVRAKKMYFEELEGMVNLIPCKMPRGYDPDRFIRENGRDELLNLMKQEKLNRIKT